MSILVLVRHGQSQWNLENKFTGWVDVPLTEKGRAEAQAGGKQIQAKSIAFDLAFTSVLQRATETLKIILEVLGIPDLPTTGDEALNERHYGDLQGLDKDETRKKFGAEQVKLWRRSYDVAPPGGEALKDTAARTLPYFDSRILPELKSGKNVLIAAHGNSLRSIVMELDKLGPEEVVALEIPTGEPILYEIDAQGQVLSKEILDNSSG